MQVAEQNAKIAAIAWQSAQKKAERATAEATIAKIDALIPLLQHRVDVRKYLVDKEFGSKLQYLSDMQELVTRQKELVVQKSRSAAWRAWRLALGEATMVPQIATFTGHRLKDVEAMLDLPRPQRLAR